ncbi:MAG: hypothetical protein EA357_06975, partial [Micavibrio sp.]
MLNAFREGLRSSWTAKLILSLLLVMAVGGLVLMDTADFWRGGVSRGAVARVAGHDIGFVEFDRFYRSSLRQQSPDRMASPEFREGLAREVLRELIRTRLLAAAARDSGLVITDGLAAQRVREYLQPWVDAGLHEHMALEYALQQLGVSEDMLVHTIKEELATDMMTSALLSVISVPEPLVRDLLQYENETRKGAYLRIARESFRVEEAGEEELRRFHKEARGKWMTPEYRGFSVLVLTPEDIIADIPDLEMIDEDGLREIYETYKDHYTTPETRTVAQAVLETEEAAKAVAAHLKSGRETSLAAAVAREGLENIEILEAEEFTAQTIYPVEITDAVFGMTAKTGIADPVKTPFGWHLAQVLETVPAQVTPFADLRDELRSQWLLEHAAEPMYRRLGELEEMFAGGATVAEAAEFLDMELMRFESVGRDGKNAEGRSVAIKPEKHAARILREVFALQQDEIIRGDLFEMEDGSYVAITIDETVPPVKIDFETVAEDVRKTWVFEEQGRLMRERAAEIEKAVREDGLSFAEAAEKFGLAVKEITPRPRRNQYTPADEKSGLSPEAMTLLFGLEKPGDVAALSAGDDMVVTILTERVLPDMASESGAGLLEDSQITGALLRYMMREDYMQQFILGLEQKYGVRINEYSFERLYGAKALREAET